MLKPLFPAPTSVDKLVASPAAASAAGVDKTVYDLPPPLQDFLDGLQRLDGVPFSYLVPDPRLLPMESLRFSMWTQTGKRHW